MYLRKLFYQSKTWFTVVVAFILCQLFINFKHGMVISPFYHYGMYSEVIRPANSYPIFAVIADGKELRAQDFSPQRWDKIIQPLVYYSRNDAHNRKMFTEIHRLTGIGDTTHYYHHVPKYDFLSWYREYLSRMLHRRIASVTIQHKTYAPGKPL